MHRPEPPPDWTPANGSVLLIDEIDKAEPELPNGLLEILGNGAFTVPYRDHAVGLAKDIPTPLVVITTNEERELPAAFVRRCLVLHLALSKDESTLKEWLVARGERHFGKHCTEAVRREAANQLWNDRQEAIDAGIPCPGQAEYLDMLRAVTELTKAEKDQDKKKQDQLDLLVEIAEFALNKASREP